MKGNVLMEAEIIDTEAYAEFARKSPEAVAAQGGRVLVRTSDIEAVQGDWEPKRLVVLEFDNLEAAKGNIASAEYAALDDRRRRATKAHIVVVEEFNPPA